MKKTVQLTIVVCSIFLLASVAVFGADQSSKAVNSDTSNAGKITPAVVAINNFMLAYQLAEYGKKNNYPLALLTAAHILKATPTKDEKQEKVVEGIPAGDQNQETGKVDTPDEMLAMAKTLVEGKDMAMVAMIDNEMKTGGTKGSTSGPIAHKDRVRGGMTDTYTIKFRGDEKAMIGIIGDDRADLDLFVYDQGGHLIRSDESSSSDCAFDWTPAWTGTYTVKVKNSGTRSSEYLLLTN